MTNTQLTTETAHLREVTVVLWSWTERTRRPVNINRSTLQVAQARDEDGKAIKVYTGTSNKGDASTAPYFKKVAEGDQTPSCAIQWAMEELRKADLSGRCARKLAEHIWEQVEDRDVGVQGIRIGKNTMLFSAHRDDGPKGEQSISMRIGMVEFPKPGAKVFVVQGGSEPTDHHIKWLAKAIQQMNLKDSGQVPRT